MDTQVITPLALTSFQDAKRVTKMMGGAPLAAARVPQHQYVPHKTTELYVSKPAVGGNAAPLSIPQQQMNKPSMPTQSYTSYRVKQAIPISSHVTFGSRQNQ